MPDEKTIRGFSVHNHRHTHTQMKRKGRKEKKKESEEKDPERSREGGSLGFPAGGMSGLPALLRAQLLLLKQESFR